MKVKFMIAGVVPRSITDQWDLAEHEQYAHEVWDDERFNSELQAELRIQEILEEEISLGDLHKSVLTIIKVYSN